jgi:hypothetical protein
MIDRCTRVVSVLAVAGLLFFVPEYSESRVVKEVNFPEQVTIENTSAKLVGVGLRKKLIINVYLGALYMQTPVTARQEVITSDQIKQVVLHFLYSEVSREQLLEAWNEGFTNNAGDAAKKLSQQISTFNGFFTTPLKKGDTIVVTYVPGKGTSVEIKNTICGTIPGKEFMEAVFSIWFGSKPPSDDLQKGMLGK